MHGCTFPALAPLPTRLKWTFMALACTAVLGACGGSDNDADEGVTAPEVTQPAPETGTPEPVPASPYADARAGDVLRVAIEALHPTQSVIGYDQIYYHLARKQPDPGRYAPSSAGYLGDDADDNYSRYLYRSERKRADDYWADNGQGGVDYSLYQPLTVRLIDPATFKCTQGEPVAGSDAAALLKTVVVGPKGVLYLTDGHHTFTALNELSDGGPQLPVWVRVVANYSDITDDKVFWQRMAENNYVWLRDALDNVIEPSALPAHIGLANFQDDAYRSLVYLTRDMGYSNAGVSEFAEFYWGSGLRAMGVDLTGYTLTNLDRARVTVTNGVVAARSGDSVSSYPAAVRDAAMRMVALGDADEVASGRTAADLGKLPAPASAGIWNDLLEEEVWRADTNNSGRYRTAGKAWYAVKYRQCGGAAAVRPACWLPAAQ